MPNKMTTMFGRYYNDITLEKKIIIANVRSTQQYKIFVKI